MNADLEDLLREGIDRLTAEAKVPPGLTDQARRQVARRKSGIAVAAGAAATLTALGAALIILLGNAVGFSPAAVRLLAKIATVAERQPSPRVRDSQFWYIKSWVSYSVCNGGTGNCVLERPHERQIWLSVSNQCRPGLLREYGHDTRLTFSSNYLHCPYRGGMNDPTYRFLQSLPTDPRTLLSLIEREMSGQQPRPQEAFTTIGDLLREAITPPRVSAALYRAAALIPGVTVVTSATDAVGRHGVAVAMTSRGVRSEWIFSKQTLLYLGERDINTADGSVNGVSAVLQRAFVSHAGQIPG
jgi:hypothetical protein